MPATRESGVGPSRYSPCEIYEAICDNEKISFAIRRIDIT